MSQRIDLNNLTAQQWHYSQLSWSEQAGDTRSADQLRRLGPPAAQPRDGYIGRLAYLLHHPTITPPRRSTAAEDL
ncbi:hypothetical protein [Nocardia sp. NPDC052566]|uniref:hypothetical protein n=1 Tax=Nocardia sp. NPDC052566 TaxID=3364330 RepID=UPI0037CC5256